MYNDSSTGMKTILSILVAEDDQTLGFLLKENLEQQGYSIMLATNGADALEFFHKKKFDLCLLDIMLPLKDGLNLCRDIRKKDPDMPVIFLTAKNQERDKIEGLKTGADDYLTKPFSMKELLLRIEAIMRRVHRHHPLYKAHARISVYQLGHLIFDYAQRSLAGKSYVKTLSTREADLLKLFCDNQNELLNRSYILKEIWKDDDYFLNKTMDVFITRLRKLLKDEPGVQIRNLYGTGFKMVVPQTSS